MNAKLKAVIDATGEMEAQRERLFSMGSHNPNRGLAQAKLHFLTLRTLYAEIGLSRTVSTESNAG